MNRVLVWLLRLLNKLRKLEEEKMAVSDNMIVILTKEGDPDGRTEIH